MTTAVVEIKRKGRWVRVRELDADGYPETFAGLASAVSAKDVENRVLMPSPSFDYAYRFDGRKVVYRCGGRGKWKPLRKLVLEIMLERCEMKRAFSLERGDKASADDMELAMKFIQKYDMLPWELKLDQDRRYVIEPDGLPVLADPKYRKFVRKGTDLWGKTRRRG